MGASKVIIVSGGSRGLGMTLVGDLLRDDHRVATFSRTESEFVTRTAAGDPERRAFYWRALDAMVFQDLRDLVREVTQHWGPLDVLINNAGVGVYGLLTLTSEEEIHRAVALNIEAVIHLTRSCLKSMIARGAGTIVNISSINGITGHSGLAVYSATKAALDGLTRSLAREVGPLGIRVNSVAPGYFQSEMTAKLPAAALERILRRIPLKRLGATEDIAGVVRFLLSDEARYVHGQTIVVDGGMSC